MTTAGLVIDTGPSLLSILPLDSSILDAGSSFVFEKLTIWKTVRVLDRLQCGGGSKEC